MRTLLIQIFVVLIIFSPWVIQAEVVPSHDITIISPTAPMWITTWQQGRNEARRGDYRLATETYDNLLHNHPEVEAIRWEYCNILYKSGNLKKSSALLAGLMEMNPQAVAYQLFAGKIALELKNYPEAIRAFTLIEQNDVNERDSLLALEGLVTALLKTSQQQKVLPLLRQLIAQNNSSDKIVLEAATITATMGLLEESYTYYQKLLTKNILLGQDALLASYFFAKDSKYHLFVTELLENYLTSFPGDIYVQQKIVSAYYQSSEVVKAIPHLELLAESGLDQNWLLLANIYHDKLKRFDKVLYCYEEYLQAHPESAIIKEKISNIQTLLAREFLVLAESGVGEQLWNDLDKVISSPMDVYLKMAEISIAEGKSNTAKELLGVIGKTTIDDDVINIRIADLYLQVDEDYIALKYLNKITEQSRSEQFYLRKRAIERKYNLSFAEYQSSLQLLLSGSSADLMIGEMITTSMQYGLSEDLDKIVAEQVVYNYLFKDLSIVLSISRFYAKCGRYTRAHHFLDVAQEIAGQDKKSMTQVLLAKGDILLNRGFAFDAEGVYRQIVQSSNFPIEAIGHLVDISLKSNQLEKARFWYEFIANKSVLENHQDENIQTKLVIIHARILVAEQHRDVAEMLLNNRMTYLQQSPLTAMRSVSEELLENELCLFWSKTGESEQCLGFLTEKDNKAQHALFLARGSSGSQQINYDSGHIAVFELAQREYQYGLYQQAKVNLQRFLKRGLHSTLAEKYLADCYLHLRKYSKALAGFTTLKKNFEQERYYTQQIEDIEGKKGNDAVLLKKLLAGETVEGFKKKNLTGVLSPQQLAENLLVTRLLWRTGKQKLSLDMYQDLLQPLQETLVGFEEKTDLDVYNSWYDVPSYFSENQTVVEQMMEPQYLIAYAGTKNAEQAALFYPTYRWQNLIQKEYNAREAVYQKKLFLAEKNYRKLFEEETSSEGMMDLATIYKRLGYYGREAQVYESVQESGVTTSALEESIEINEQQRKPQISLEGSFLNRDGRDGAVDITKYQYGTSAWVTPDFNQEYFVKYLRTNYQDDSFGKESNFFGVGGKYEFSDDNALSFELGGEDLSGYGDLKISGLARLDYRLSDQIRSYVELNQHRIDDTIEAVDQQIFSQTVEGGLVLETLIGLEVGGDYSYSLLTDENEQQRAHGWLFYNIFGEITQLDFHYDYEYITSEFSSEDVPYWSPQDYQNHALSLYFQHQFSTILPKEELNSYYSLEYVIGFENEQNISYTAKCDIFLEINSNFLLKSSFLYSKSDDYDESAGSLNIVYRW